MTSPPSPTTSAALRAALDDLGLVVEGIERVGEGLDDVVVARVLEIDAIEGADKIRRVTVDAGGRVRSRSCAGRDNFDGRRPGPAGPGRARSCPAASRSADARCAASSPTACCARASELGLSDDEAGLLILGDEAPGDPGTPLTEALGLEPDVVFDITVEGNRPDAWSMAGIARDLAARLGLPFADPEPPDPPASGRPVESAASAAVDVASTCAPASPSPCCDDVDGRAVAAVDRPPAAAGRACARSTTWSTRRTT